MNKELGTSHLIDRRRFLKVGTALAAAAVVSALAKPEEVQATTEWVPEWDWQTVNWPPRVTGVPDEEVPELPPNTWSSAPLSELSNPITSPKDTRTFCSNGYAAVFEVART